MNFDFKPRVLVEKLAGSHAYGTARPESDLDIRGVIVPPAQFFFGLSRFEHFEVPERDTVLYELRHFLRLSSGGNPAFLEMWWAPEASDADRAGQPHPKLRGWWELFRADLWPCILSKKLLKPHLGMAQAHLKKIERPGQKCGVKGRKAIAEHGWNTKDASHVIRVLHQAHELLTTGKLTFPRPEAAMLVDIRAGNWTLEQVRAAEADLAKLIKEAGEKSDLRETPDLKLVDQWLVSHVPGLLEDLRTPPEPLTSSYLMAESALEAMRNQGEKG